MGGGVHKRSLVSEINITPFVDVMLVLLIIFMVTAPLMTQGLDVDLPQTQAVDVLPTDSDNIILTVKADGSMFLDEYKVEPAELEGFLSKLVKEKNKQLFLQADKAVPYGVVVEVMGRAKLAGIEKIGMVADKVEDTGNSALPRTTADAQAEKSVASEVQGKNNSKK